MLLLLIHLVIIFLGFIGQFVFKVSKKVLLLLSRVLSDIFKLLLMCKQQSKPKRLPTARSPLGLEDRTIKCLTFVHKRFSSLIIKIVGSKKVFFLFWFYLIDSVVQVAVTAFISNLWAHTQTHVYSKSRILVFSVVGLPTISNHSQRRSVVQVYRTEQDFLWCRLLGDWMVEVVPVFYNKWSHFA